MNKNEALKTIKNMSCGLYVLHNIFHYCVAHEYYEICRIIAPELDSDINVPILYHREKTSFYGDTLFFKQFNEALDLLGLTK